MILNLDEMQFCKKLPDVIIIGVKKCGTITLGRNNHDDLLLITPNFYRKFSELPSQHICKRRDTFL